MDLMMPPRVESGLGSLYLSLLYQIPILPIIPNSVMTGSPKPLSHRAELMNCSAGAHKGSLVI